MSAFNLLAEIGPKQRPILTIVQSTHASLDGFKAVGLLERHRRLLREYAKVFDVVLYSSDIFDYSAELGIKHKPVPWLPRTFGYRHLVFYLWLILQAPHMKGVIKVFGSNIPTLPLVKWLSGRPMLVTYQFDYAEGTRMNEKKGLKYLLAPLLERLALWPADLVLVTAKWLNEKIQKFYAKKTILLPNWVDLSSVSLACKEIVRNDHLIVYAGRLHWIKGINVLIDAFARLKLFHPDAQLVICGTGEEKEKLCAQAEALGLSDVQFEGRVSNSDVLKLMQSAGIFVLPTLTMEGHPKSLIEAMACGAACIVSNVPGNSDAIIDEETGLLVPPGDVNALADTLNRLIKDSYLRKRLSSNAQRKAQAFDFLNVVTAEMKIIRSMYPGP